MRSLPLSLLLLCTCLSPAFSAPDPAREAALDVLLSERGAAPEFEKAAEKARAAGISPQAILEARFLYHVDRREDDAIAAMLPDFLKQDETFKLADSQIFSVKEDWLAVVEYVKAMDRLKQGDKAGFKNHITEAFWLSPRQAAAFAPHIERVRLEEMMRGVKVDFNTRLLPMNAGSAIALSEIKPGHKALLLHFWSPRSPECEASLPDFLAAATALDAKGVAVVSLLPDDSAALLEEARTMLQPLAAKAPGEWRIDSKEAPLARDLRVQALPLFVLVSNDGSVLFNGDPADDGFWEALRRVDPSITRPERPDEAE